MDCGSERKRNGSRSNQYYVIIVCRRLKVVVLQCAFGFAERNQEETKVKVPNRIIKEIEIRIYDLEKQGNLLRIERDQSKAVL